MPGGRKARPVAERFWEKVDKGADPDGCWLWSGARRTDGYGVVGVGSRTDNSCRLQSVHRLSWTLHHGVIPSGLFVCHACDVRLCVRPDHLFLGTQAENLKDMDRKNRRVAPPHSRGLAHPMARLDAYDVRFIRRSTDNGIGARPLARLLGVTHRTVMLCRSHRTYEQVGG